jgi:hypothetical protein
LYGHSGAAGFDNSLEDDSDVSPISIGNVAFPDEIADHTANVRVIAGGYVNIYSKADCASRKQLLKRKGEERVRGKKANNAGVEKRRWTGKSGKRSGARE